MSFASVRLLESRSFGLKLFALTLRLKVSHFILWTANRRTLKLRTLNAFKAWKKVFYLEPEKIVFQTHRVINFSILLMWKLSHSWRKPKRKIKRKSVQLKAHLPFVACRPDYFDFDGQRKLNSPPSWCSCNSTYHPFSWCVLKMRNFLAVTKFTCYMSALFVIPWSRIQQNRFLVKLWQLSWSNSD